jgi:hypothetical protein
VVTLNKQGGSMGMPEEMRQAIQSKQDSKTESPSQELKEKVSEDVTDTPEGEKDYLSTGASDILKKLGITVEDKDVGQLILKGSLAKTIEVIPKFLTVTLKTMVTAEYDAIDEFIGREIIDLKMTTQGMETRKSVLRLCFAVTQINGKALLPTIPKLPDGEIDYQGVIRQMRPIFKNMSASVVDKIVQKRDAYELAMSMVVDNPESLLKNS